MNFFGHAVVASWHSVEPGFVLGAMLPDFERLGGVSPEEVAGDVVAGLDLHHRTDRVFHDVAAFQRLCADAAAALRDAGIARGPARAAAHVGVELLLDGVLASDERACRAYQDALSSAAAGALERQARFALHAEPRWKGLLARVARSPVPAVYRDPGAVAERVVMMLGQRPRLRISDDASPAVHAVLPHVQLQVRLHAPQIVADLAAGVGPG